MEILEHYHPILLKKSEVCEIFRISPRTAQLWAEKYGWKRKGRKFLTSSIKKTIEELTQA
tara:strand:- start:65 stop:244 length:180 start_codon:yes stop_codon:yes gene_type:complete